MDRIIKIFKVGAVVSDRQYLLRHDHRPSSSSGNAIGHVDASDAFLCLGTKNIYSDYRA